MNDQGTGGLRSFREAESAEQIGGHRLSVGFGERRRRVSAACRSAMTCEWNGRRQMLPTTFCV